MESLKLGNFEELVLLLVAVLQENAYSVGIVEEYEKQFGKSINISAIHTVLYRLQKKNYLASQLGEAESKRGGKRKRVFYLTAEGKQALTEMQGLRDQLKNQIPAFALPPNL